MKKYNQSKDKKQEVASQDEITDDELWLRLEELELQEELENEYENTKTEENELESDDNSFDSFIIKEDDVSNTQTDVEKTEAYIVRTIPKQTSKIGLIQQVIDRQKMLESKLNEMKNRERTQTKTEEDLLSRLDEIGQLDEVEDEMNRYIISQI